MTEKILLTIFTYSIVLEWQHDNIYESYFSSEESLGISKSGDGMPCWIGYKKKCCKKYHKSNITVIVSWIWKMNERGIKRPLQTLLLKSIFHRLLFPSNCVFYQRLSFLIGFIRDYSFIKSCLPLSIVSHLLSGCIKYSLESLGLFTYFGYP